MKKLRLVIAISVCKLLIRIGRLVGKKGTSKPGEIALKICPDILTMLSGQVKGDIIAVCGTNGKTTTNNMIYSYLKANGKNVVCNNVGANMIYGVCCAFAAKASLLGKLDADYACLEIDEASAVKIFKFFSPDILVITNLFRDQLDRYGEIDLTVDYLKRALDLAPYTKLILNGDDPVCAQFGREGKRECYYFSVSQKVLKTEEESSEGRFCPICGNKLDYNYYHYSQLGDYACNKCGFKRPEPHFAVNNVCLENGMRFELSYFDNKVQFDINYRGFYNIYNVAVSYSAARLALGKLENYRDVLAQYKPQTGRMEEFNIGKKVILNLSKNPAGFNQGIATVLEDSTFNKVVLIGINDNAGDGKDISWLWDVDFEKLETADVSRYILCGMRADDLALRLKYGGIEEGKMKKFSALKDAAEAINDGNENICYALVNYTVVFQMQEILSELKREWENEI
ncbi:MAG: DUF1727 domain-containing protein [Ruminococcaceae bacterium]|nr:DUF1727 domain-containing protein [Oscillospiraceae bacterium]